jgi:hypothetical protein
MIEKVDVLLDDAIVDCVHIDLLFSNECAFECLSLNVFDDNFTGKAAKSLFDRSSYMYNYQ